MKYTRKALIKSYGWFSIVPVIKHISLDSFFSLQIKCMCANSGRATMFQIKKQKFQEFFSKLLSDPPFWKSVKKSRTKNVAGSKNFFYQSSRAFHILGGEWGFWSQKTPFWKGAKSTRLKKSSNQTRLEYKLSGIFCKLAGELCVFGRNLKKCGFYSHKTFFRFCTLEGKKAHKNEEKKNPAEFSGLIYSLAEMI